MTAFSIELGHHTWLRQATDKYQWLNLIKGHTSILVLNLKFVFWLLPRQEIEPYRRWTSLDFYEGDSILMNRSGKTHLMWVSLCYGSQQMKRGKWAEYPQSLLSSHTLLHDCWCDVTDCFMLLPSCLPFRDRLYHQSEGKGNRRREMKMLLLNYGFLTYINQTYQTLSSRIILLLLLFNEEVY